MSTAIHVSDLDNLKNTIAEVTTESANKQHVSYVDVRVEAGEGIGSYSEDGNPKATSQDWGFSIGVRVISGSSLQAAGYFGRSLGVKDYTDFASVMKNAISTAKERALVNAKQKEEFVKKFPDFGKTVQSTVLAPIEVHQETVAAEYEIDPRTVTQKEITELAQEAAQAAQSHHENIKRVEVVANSAISRQIFASSEGALIDQSTCSSGGTVFVTAVDDEMQKPADLYHHTGNQLGFEAISKGINTHEMDLQSFAKEIAQEAVLLSKAPPAPATDKPVTVVLDPDLVALFAHEIIGHPSELDRAMKMETGYAGRSWFFNNLQDTMVDKQVGSPLLNAFSDPTLKGAYGYYKYDDEGTPAKRVYHIKDGIYKDFMNSRQTAHTFSAKPNGHYKANDASVVPLIRMSVSAIEAGDRDPHDIIAEVEDGFYAVGHRIPSISESRENFQIAPRLIYEIKNGQLGQVYRDGRITADSKAFFMSIDALGNDFKIFALPNCGKGQPMQTKQVGNGGPTARAMAKIARG